MRQRTVDAFAPGLFTGDPANVVEPFDAWPDELRGERVRLRGGAVTFAEARLRV